MLKIEIEKNYKAEFRFISATMICNWCDKEVTRDGPAKNVVGVCGEKGWKMKVSINGKEWMVACDNPDCLRGLNYYEPGI